MSVSMSEKTEALRNYALKYLAERIVAETYANPGDPDDFKLVRWVVNEMLESAKAYGEE